jgi:hypothetical protein
MLAIETLRVTNRARKALYTYSVSSANCNSIVLSNGLEDVVVLFAGSERCGHVGYVSRARLGGIFLVKFETFHVVRVDTSMISFQIKVS